MPYRVNLRPDLNLIVMRGLDEITQDDIESALTEIPRMAGFRPDRNMLVDFRECTTRIDWWQVRFLADFAREREALWGRSKWAILVDSDLNYGLVRIYVALANRGTVQSEVFRDPDTALAWLKMPGEAGAPLDALAIKLAADETAEGERER